MRQLSTILFLSLSLIIQYNKQWNYVQCRIANTFKFAAAKCDCEKASEPKDNAEAPPVRSFVHFHLDELYTSAALETINPSLAISFKNSIAYSEDSCQGYLSRLYHPPRS